MKKLVISDLHLCCICSLYFKSPCESDPCKNGADGVPEYDLNSYPAVNVNWDSMEQTVNTGECNL